MASWWRCGCSDSDDEAPEGYLTLESAVARSSLGADRASSASAASLPVRCLGGSSTSAMALRAKSMLQWPSTLTPPSVEDEKEYMRNSFERLQEEQLSAPKECLLCMEGFTVANPEVRTLCKCGVNANHYHLRCLFAWHSRSGKATCPVCDNDLFFEEDDAGGISTSSSASLISQGDMPDVQM